MDRNLSKPTAASKSVMTLDSSINVVVVGAGIITFGVDYEPWNHSIRIEAVLGSRLNVLAIIDPNQARVESVLAEKAQTAAKDSYATTKWYPSVGEAYKDGLGSQLSIDLFVLAAPPDFRGTTVPGRDLELEIVKLFGTDPVIFTEKPVAAVRPAEPFKVADRLDATNARIGVGYMMRYLKVVQKARQIIVDNNLTIMCALARYAFAYNLTRKAEWWRKSGNGGPAVEQMTHFCDLLRYLVGEVDKTSVRVTTLEHDEPASTIKNANIDEDAFDPDDRIPRVTSATWKFDTGAVGTFTHIIALHGQKYAEEITLLADGYQLRIANVYTNPTLYVRSPESDSEEKVYKYDNDDAFFDEFVAFASEACRRSGKPGIEHATDDLAVDHILSSYRDACKSYEFTWLIRDSGDEYAAHRRAKGHAQGEPV